MNFIVRKFCILLLLSIGLPWFARAANPVPSVTIGQNFVGSTYGVNVSSIPPDVNGHVGPRHFVEFINGAFVCYNKTNHATVKRISDEIFWSNAGVTVASSQAITDPRIVYDPQSQRWFASMVDFDANAAANGLDPTLEANDFLIAVSATSDPTGTWHGFRLQSDPDNGYFADFPTLGIDTTGVYLSGDFYQGENNPLGAGLVSFPKSDLIAATPSIDNRTWFGVMAYEERGDVLQPANCFDGTCTGAVVAASDIGSDSFPHSNLVCFAVQNAGGPGATLTPTNLLPTLPWVVPDNSELGVPQFTVAQPDGTHALLANDARFCSKVYAVGGVLYAVHNTDLGGYLGIRWYRIRASDRTLLESGTISDPNLDLFFPSIAANPSGVVTICFNGSGPSTLVSSFAVVGQTINGVTTFGNRTLLQSGTTSYHGDDELIAQLLGDPVVSRWGDYSATSVDPNDPNRFWTIQMIPTGDDVWSTRITEIITAIQPALSIQQTSANVAVSWAVSPGYHLTTATNLAGTVIWANVSQTPVTNNNQVTVTVPSSARQQFFRLQKP